MILYHGSYMEVRTPDLNHSRKSVDFGSGFYITTISRQGFYQYLARQGLADVMRSIHEEDLCNNTYGSRRIGRPGSRRTC